MDYPRLYKYFHPDRTDVLKTGHFRFTQPAAMNDPFDVSPFISVGSEEYIREKITQSALKELESGSATLELLKGMRDYDVLKQWAEEDMRAEIEFRVEMWKQHQKEMAEGLKKTISEQVGLFCMTANPSSILMWSHYADSHRGFALEFDASHRFFAEEEEGKIHLCQVQYSSVRPGFSPHSDLTVDPMFTKGLDWKYEKEWRLVKLLNQADRHMSAQPFDIYLFRIPWEAMKTLILGANMPDSQRERVLNLVEQNPELHHLEVMFARPDPQRFRLILRQKDDPEILSDRLVFHSIEATPLDEQERFKGYCRDHISKIRQRFAVAPGYAIIDGYLSKLLREDILTFTTWTAIQRMKMAFRDNQHYYEGKKFEDIYVVISVIPTWGPSKARTYFPAGYNAFLDDRLNESTPHTMGLAHWVFCEDQDNRSINLTFLPPLNKMRQSALLVLAGDLITEAEKSRWARYPP